MSRHFRITIAIIGTVVGLVAAALGIMSTSWFRRTLERRLIVALEDMTGGRVEVREFRFHPIVLQAIFNGFVLHGSEMPQDPPFFAARTVVLRLSPTNLLHREVRILSLDWDGAELHLKTYPDGSTNLPSPVASLSAGQVMAQLIDLRIGRVSLAHSTLFWNDRAINLDLGASDVAFLLHLRRGGRYEGSLAASSVTARTPSHSPPPLAFSALFTLSKNELAVTSLSYKSRGIIGQGSLTFHPAPEPEGYFSFQSSFEAAALNPLLSSPGLQNGNIRLEGQGILRRGELSARGRLQTRQLMFRDARFDSGPLDISAEYALNRSQLALSNLKLLGWGGSALGEGQVSISGLTPQAQVRVRVRDMNLVALLGSAKNRPLLLTKLRPASILEGVVELSWVGEFEKLKSNFDVHLSAPATHSDGSLPLSGDMRGALQMNPGFSMNLQDSTLHTPHSTLHARGTLVDRAGQGESPGRLEIQLQTDQFEEWRSMFEAPLATTPHLPLTLASAATLAGEITGSIRNPELHGSVRLGKFEYRGWIWDGLQATLALGANSLQVSSGKLAHGASVLTVEASTQLEDWRITKTSQVRFSARARLTPVEGLKAALGIDYPVAGQLSGQVDMTGTASSLEGVGAVRLENGNFDGENFDSFSARIRVRESAWDLDSIGLVKGHGRVTGKAQIETSDRSLMCQLHGAGFSLADFKGLAHEFPGLTSSHVLEGQASFDLQGSGTPNHFRFRSSGLLQNLSIGGAEVGDFHIQLDGDGQNVQLHGSVSGPSGMFSLSGDVQASGDWPLQLQGQYASLRLDPWARLLGNDTFSAQVTASGSFTATGSLRDASKLDLHSQVETLEVSFPSLKWRNENPIEVRYAENRLSARPFRMQGPSTDLVIDGSIGLSGPPALSLTVHGVADATILSLLQPGLQASGQSRISLSVSGPPAKPQMNGVIEIRDVGLEYPGLPLRLSGLNGEIQLEGEKATVKSLRAISGGGTVTLEGLLTLALPPRVDITAKLDQVRVHYPVDFTSILSGTLRWTGTSDRSQLRGDLALSQVLASGSRFWLGQMMQPSNPFQNSGPPTASTLADSVRLNIRVSSPAPVRLEVQDMRLTADVDVRMQGSLANPVELGAVHFLNGQAVVRGNRFNLTRGDLNMTNPLRTQATLDLEAQTRVQQYDLTVDVSGPVGRLKMTYRSDPPLPTEDVFSLLALGYARQQQQASASGLVSSFTGGNPLQSVGESALLSEALSNQVTGRIQHLFGVSRIKIDPNVGLPGLSTGQRVTVEQQVTKDLTLTYITNTASSQYQIIQFEYAFGDNISLLGVRDPNGIVGVELRFRRRFK